MPIKIFIDPGHNPKTNAGAEGFGFTEQDITYDIGNILYDLLKGDYRFEVMISRKSKDEVIATNQSTSLINRVEQANKFDADYFLSIHCNANENQNINGSEIYVYNRYTQAYYLAEIILKEITENLKTKNNGVKINKSFYVLRKTKMPALLIELAYITNYEDLKKLTANGFDFAFSIYLGLLSYFDLQKL
ncbi:MAG: N-acetylmuramoyl-L-alanine amidase [Clostridia bacterium]|nr:N-acetylmuramoyl-L-alanine amidase [Clostridia bacterium]